MAAEMLDKILEAEKAAKEKYEQTEAEALKIIEKASDEGRTLLENAKRAAEDNAQKCVAESSANANKLIENKLSEAKAYCEKMYENSISKSVECEKIIINKLIY